MKLDVLEASGGEEIVDCSLLAISDFEGDEAAWNERREGGGNEAAVDVEAIVAGEEGERGFVVADFDGEGVAISAGNVRRIGDDEIELFTGNGGEEIALKKADAIVDAVAFCVCFGEGEGRFGDVCGCDLCLGQVVREGNSDCAGAGTDVENAGRATSNLSLRG